MEGDAEEQPSQGRIHFPRPQANHCMKYPGAAPPSANKSKNNDMRNRLDGGIINKDQAPKEIILKDDIKNQSPQRDVSAPAESSKREIREVLACFARSIRSYDPLSLERCFRVDHDREGELVKADMLQQCVIRRLQDAWTTRFKNPIVFDTISFLAFPTLDGGFEILFEKTLEQLDDAHIQLQDDRARVPILFGGVDHEPPESSLRKWQGAWITFCNDGLEWKVDLSATIRINASLMFHPGALPRSSRDEEDICIAFTRDMSELLLHAAQAVESGRFPNGAEASEHIRSEASKIFRAHNLYGISLHPWPARPTSREMTR
jgi:hypothetical protein